MRSALAAVLVLLVACAGGAAELRYDDAVPGDLRELADATWGEFLDAFPARQGCVESLELVGSRELDVPAAYVPVERRMYVRIPGTAGALRNALVHEFAHHLEFTCDDHAALRPAFLAAQGFPADAGWFDAATWETTPSEHFAEAAVEAVLGRRLRNRDVLITDAAVAAVVDWGRGN